MQKVTWPCPRSHSQEEAELGSRSLRLPHWPSSSGFHLASPSDLLLFYLLCPSVFPSLKSCRSASRVAGTSPVREAHPRACLFYYPPRVSRCSPNEATGGLPCLSPYNREGSMSASRPGALFRWLAELPEAFWGRGRAVPAPLMADDLRCRKLTCRVGLCCYTDSSSTDQGRGQSAGLGPSAFAHCVPWG